MNTPTTQAIDKKAKEIAKAFIEVLHEWLSEEELTEIRNKIPGYREGCCPTHEYCDASMAMYLAFKRAGYEDVTGDPFNRMYNELWNQAWDIATKRKFKKQQ